VAEEQKEPKRRRSYGERAAVNIRAARRNAQALSEPAARIEFVLAEAKALALLELADALRETPPGEASGLAGQAELLEGPVGG
jgi:hypothetical protein